MPPEHKHETMTDHGKVIADVLIQLLKNNNFYCYRNRHFVIAGWSVGPKPVSQNDVFIIRPKYYDKAENQRAVLL